MNQRTAEAMAATIQTTLGSRARCVRVTPTIERSFSSERVYFSVYMIVDNHLHLGFAEPHQWQRMKDQYGL